MPLGLLTGLGAAVAWGTLDILSALASRQVGSLRVTTGMQIVGGSCPGAGRGHQHRVPDRPVRAGRRLARRTGRGPARYLSYFTGLRIGPIAA